MRLRSHRSVLLEVGGSGKHGIWSIWEVQKIRELDGSLRYLDPYSKNHQNGQLTSHKAQLMRTLHIWIDHRTQAGVFENSFQKAGDYELEYVYQSLGPTNMVLLITTPTQRTQNTRATAH